MFIEQFNCTLYRLDRVASRGTMLGTLYGRTLRCPGVTNSETRLYATQRTGIRQGWEAGSTSEGRDDRRSGRGRDHGPYGSNSYERSSTSRFPQRNDRFGQSDDNDHDDDNPRYGRRSPRPASAPPRRLPYKRDFQGRDADDGYDKEAAAYPGPDHEAELADEDAGEHGSSSSRTTAVGASPSSSYQDTFDSMHSHLSARLQEGQVIRRESWEKLFGHLLSPRHGASALALMQRDAAVREAAGWDWGTHGYGQTAFQLVQAAAAADAPEIAEQLLAAREEIHLTMNKDLLPGLIRKVAAATTDADSLDDAHVAVVRRLYEQEALLRGANTPEAAYELSRVLRRAGDVRGVCSLADQIRDQDLAVRPRLMEDLARWLAKRGVKL